MYHKKKALFSNGYPLQFCMCFVVQFQIAVCVRSLSEITGLTSDTEEFILEYIKNNNRNLSKKLYECESHINLDNLIF